MMSKAPIAPCDHPSARANCGSVELHDTITCLLRVLPRSILERRRSMCGDNVTEAPTGLMADNGEEALGISRRPASRPNSAVALVDLDNWHEAVTSRPIEATLREVVTEVTEKLLDLGLDVMFVSIRLYGGWTELGSFSQSASRVAEHLSAVDPFPIPVGGRLVHGGIHLATGLSIDPTVEIGDLCRVRKGPPRIRLAGKPRPEACIDHEQCAAKALQRFTAKASRICPTDGCPVTSGDAFATRQQKMVDTLMACDLLDFAHDADVLAISIVTADTDLMPPLLHALILGGKKILLQTNLPYWPPGQVATLRSCGLIYLGPQGGDDEQSHGDR